MRTKNLAIDGDPVEIRLYVWNVEERHQPYGLLRPDRLARRAAVVGGVHQQRGQPAARRAESKARGDGGGDEKKTEELVAAAAKDGTRILSEVGSMWYNYRGNDEATAIRHTFIAMPNFKGSQIGLPEVRDSGGIWLMQAGTPEAHIMLPGR